MSRKRIKQYLMLLTAVGVVAVAASGAGTFATFNAEVSNNGNTFTAGTLFLHDTNGTNTCTSEQGTANANNGSSWTDRTNGCSVLFDVNVGKATLSTTLASAPGSNPVSSISVTGLNVGVNPGDVLTITNGSSQSENVIVKTAVAATNTNPTSIPIYSEDLTNAYTTGNTVKAIDTTHYSTLALNDAGSLAASGLKFFLPGCTAGHPTTESLGSFASAGTAGGGNTTFTLGSNAAYAAPSGAIVKINSTNYTLASATSTSSPTVVVTGTAAASEAPGSILWVPTFSSQNFCNSAQITIAETDPSFDLTTAKNPVCVFGNSGGGVYGCVFDSTHTLQSGAASPAATASAATALSLVSGSSAGGVGNGNTGTGLDSGGTRYFLIGVSLPSSSNNDYQNQSATFGLGWHIDAA